MRLKTWMVVAAVFAASGSAAGQHPGDPDVGCRTFDYRKNTDAATFDYEAAQQRFAVACQGSTLVEVNTVAVRLHLKPEYARLVLDRSPVAERAARSIHAQWVHAGVQSLHMFYNGERLLEVRRDGRVRFLRQEP